MKNVTLGILVLWAFVAVAAQEKYAPLPDKLVAARTVFLENDTGEHKFSDHIFEQLQQWGRWRIVTNRGEADVVISLDHKDRFHNDFYLRVLDRESGETLWTAKKDVAIGGWTGTAKALLSDLRKRLPPTPPQP